MRNEDESDYRNPNAEDYVLQPGEKRVRFSICETTFHSQDNPAFEQEEPDNEKMETNPNDSDSTFQQVRSRRRDSVYPLDNDKRIIISNESESGSASPFPLGEVDPFALVEVEEEEPGPPWSSLSANEKLWKVGIGISKAIALLGLLYFFVCSLDLLSKGFRLIGGRTAGEIFRQSEILQNPVVGVMIGILTTVLVQSSSTSTSIIVGMVAAGFMDVKLAIPLIMGANIGTSITNTIVSFMQAGDRDQFRRAFAGATILDMFNWLAVIVLLFVEVTTGYLFVVSKAVVDLLVADPESGGEIQLLSVLTTPFINLIVQLDESVLECWSNPNCTEKYNSSLLKEYCKTTTAKIEVIERLSNAQGVLVSTNSGVKFQESNHTCAGEFIFAGTSLSDALVGVIILLISLFVLCTCLILIVKVLSSVLKGHVSIIIKKTLNANIPYVPWITGYIAIFIGALMTFMVQSSSVFTSALTPLVGLGVISLERVYPLTLGSNIGTTTTAVLASLAVEGKSFHPSMQIALCHFFFNITGIILFYPIPFMRFPIQLAKFLGNTTAKYRWFAVAYMVIMFAILPAIFIGLSFAGPAYVIALVSSVGILLVVIFIVSLLQQKLPSFLPPILRTWKWLPSPLRSLEPYDRLFSKLPCCARCNTIEMDTNFEDDKDNFIFYPGTITKTKEPVHIPSSLKKRPATSNNNGNGIVSYGHVMTSPDDGNPNPVVLNGNLNASNDRSNSNNNNQNNNNSSNGVNNVIGPPVPSSHSNSNQSNNNVINTNDNDDSRGSRGDESSHLNATAGSDNEGYRGSTESVIV